MPVKKWQEIDTHHVADMRIFQLWRHTMRNPRNDAKRSIARIESPDWVNVVALTEARDVVLVRQWRHGTRHATLEIPGGLVEAGETPHAAAVRELREETGHTGGASSDIGVVEPNPAIFSNRCHTVLVEGCAKTQELALDAGEDIEVIERPLMTIPALIADGSIDHALVVCGFWWLALKRPDLFALGPCPESAARGD